MAEVHRPPGPRRRRIVESVVLLEAQLLPSASAALVAAVVVVVGRLERNPMVSFLVTPAIPCTPGLAREWLRMWPSSQVHILASENGLSV